MNGVATNNESAGVVRVFARSWTISPTLLFLTYAVLPICLIIVAVDLLFLGGSIRDAMPTSPRYWAIWAIVFQLPHITASILTMADKDYIKGYRPVIWKGLLIAAGLSVLVPPLLGVNTFLIVLAAYTVYHVYMQQYGISLMLLKTPPDRYFNAWKYLSISGVAIGTAVVLYPQLFHPSALPIHVTIPMARVATATLYGTGLIPLFIFAHRVFKNQSPKSIAVYYFIANPVMLLTGFTLFQLGYPAFTIIIPRFVHDVTAYIVYIVHDHNRNLGGAKNIVYKLLSPFHISPALLCLPVSMGLAYLLTVAMPTFTGLVIAVNIMVFFHYYLEGRIWRGPSLHRRNAPFAPAGKIFP